MQFNYSKAVVWLSSIILLSSLIGACGGGKSNGSDNCSKAVAGCQCYPNNTCELGYECGLDGLCSGSGIGNGGTGGIAGNDTSGGSGGDLGVGGSIGCEVGWLNCNGCINPNDNPLYCGGCDQPCVLGDVCEAGQCKQIADCTVTPCSGFTYCDLLTKKCNPGCGSEANCALNETCDLTTHACGCKEGFHSCSNVCVDNNSPSTCGASCSFCPSALNASSTCDGTNCGLACNQGFVQCGGNCYPDTGGGESTDACGSNCSPCAPKDNATVTCSNGSCNSFCNNGFGDCGGNCYSSAELVTFCENSCSPCPPIAGATASCLANQCEYTCTEPGKSIRCGRCVTGDGGDPCNSDADCCTETSFHQACVDGLCQNPYRPCGVDFSCPAGMQCEGDSSPGYCTIDCTDVSQCPQYLPLLYPDIHLQCFDYCYMSCDSGNPCPAGFNCVNFSCEY